VAISTDANEAQGGACTPTAITTSGVTPSDSVVRCAENSSSLSRISGQLVVDQFQEMRAFFAVVDTAAFMALHPKVVLDVTLSDRLVDLVDEGYDLAVRIARLQASLLVSRQLATTRMILCASPTYLRRHGVHEPPSDMAQHAVISYTLMAMGELWEFEGPEGPVSVKVRPRMRTNSGDTDFPVDAFRMRAWPA
jgi:DNA-binding transcriptional LysR family regulator